MFSLEKRCQDGWELVPSDTYDLGQLRHVAEAEAEKTGVAHRIINERKAILFCTGNGCDPCLEPHCPRAAVT